MSTLNISLPESMREFIDRQIDDGGYSTASEYIRHLIRLDQEKVEKKQIEKLLLEGLNNGEIDNIPLLSLSENLTTIKK